MATQLKLFSANGAENLGNLEKEINTWLTAEDARIQPVNSQTATCIQPDGKQAVVISLWYLDPSMPGYHR